MEGIISKITEVLGGIPILGDIIKKIMEMLGMGGDEEEEAATE